MTKPEEMNEPTPFDIDEMLRKVKNDFLESLDATFNECNLPDSNNDNNNQFSNL